MSIWLFCGLAGKCAGKCKDLGCSYSQCMDMRGCSKNWVVAQWPALQHCMQQFVTPNPGSSKFMLCRIYRSSSEVVHHLHLRQRAFRITALEEQTVLVHLVLNLEWHCSHFQSPAYRNYSTSIHSYLSISSAFAYGCCGWLPLPGPFLN